MKKYLLMAGLLLNTCLVFAQDREAILNVMDNQQTAWNRGDLEVFMNGYWRSDSLLFVGKSAPTKGW